MLEERVENRFEKAFEQAAGLNPVFPAAARQQMAQMVEIIAKSNENIDKIMSYAGDTARDAAQRGGFIAEEVHVETFNLDSALKGDTATAYTDRYEDWSNFEWNGSKLKRNDVPDIIVVRDGKVVKTVQSKSNSTAESTAAAMSDVRDGKKPYYEDVDSLLGPKDQVDGEYKFVPEENRYEKTTTIKEHAEAKAEALEKQGMNNVKAKAHRQTAEKVTSKVEDGDSSSTPLTKEEADQLGNRDKKRLKEIEGQYQTKSTLKQMGNAAIGAAAMSAVISGSINTVNYIALAKKGKITLEEAALKIVGETVASAADSAVKAAATTGAHSLLVRYGSKELMKEALAKQGLKTMLRGNAVTVGVVCAIDAVKDLVRLGMGDISKDEFYERQGKGILMTTAGVVGGSFGAAGAAGMALALGAAEGSTALAVASAIGGLSGGIIAGLAMTLAIENGIEKPYRDLVQNTQTLNAVAVELERVSQTALKSQIVFTQFVQINAHLDKEIQNQFRKIDESGKRALDAINRI